MKTYTLLFLITFNMLFIACNGQENQKRIGKEFGMFDIDKISFSENLDSLFAKSAFFVITKKNSHFDTIQNRQIWTDTLLYIYRIPHEKVDGLYSFKNLKVKDAVVSFASDKNKKFRKVDFSVYISTAEYQNFFRNAGTLKMLHPIV